VQEWKLNAVGPRFGYLKIANLVEGAEAPPELLKARAEVSPL
jgi:hypothetical protein